jgi:hypothetical protein
MRHVAQFRLCADPGHYSDKDKQGCGRKKEEVRITTSDFFTPNMASLFRYASPLG